MISRVYQAVPSGLMRCFFLCRRHLREVKALYILVFTVFSRCLSITSNEKSCSVIITIVTGSLIYFYVMFSITIKKCIRICSLLYYNKLEVVYAIKKLQICLSNSVKFFFKKLHIQKQISIFLQHKYLQMNQFIRLSQPLNITIIKS